MLNKIVLILTAALGLTMSAHANIGDTRHKSDLRYGRPTIVGNGEFKFRDYSKGNWLLSTLFEKNQGRCVYIQYSHTDGSNLSDNEIEMLLNDNLIGNYHWARYDGGSRYATWWDGGYFYAMYLYQSQTYQDGRTRTAPTLRISNQATLAVMGLWLGTLPTNDASSTSDDVNSI